MIVNIYFLAAAAGVAVFAWELYKGYSRRHEKGIKDTVLAAINDLKIGSIDPLLTKVAVMEERVSILWTTDQWWRKAAMDAVTILHHPETSRERVDHLLDCFKAGTITCDEIVELKGYLEAIISYDESKPPPFKMFPGEGVAASILLHTIDHMTTPEDAPDNG